MCALFSKVAAEKPDEPFCFSFYAPVIQTDRLVPGIDNIRFDVSLSSKFLEQCRGFLFQLIVKHSEAAELLHRSPDPLKPVDIKEFKQQLQNLLLTALNHANAEKNSQLELLAQAAIFKYLLGELQAQYAVVVVQGREKLKLFEGPAQQFRPRRYQLQEIFSNFQKDKKIILRRVSQELLEWVHEVRNDTVRKVRESFFGNEASEPQRIFFTPLLFTEDGRDDFLYLEHYVMLGNFQRDADRWELVDRPVRNFVEWADVHSEEARQYHRQREVCAQTEARLEGVRQQREKFGEKKSLLSLGKPAPPPPDSELDSEIRSLESQLQEHQESLRLLCSVYKARLDTIISEPGNADRLVDVFQTERQISEARKAGAGAAEISSLEQAGQRQREALERLYEQLSHAGLIPYILAAYETASICARFCPPLNPHQIKAALMDRNERKKVAHLIREYRLPEDSGELLEEAARRIRDAGVRQIRPLLVRFLRDYMRCQHDLCNYSLAQNLMERVHIPTDPKQRELSEINHTLYRFLLAEEEKPLEEKVANHVILKADIRDSTSITEQLFARGLNPASYFSLNFFSPIHKLLPRYGASKVFIEGDAVILAILEQEGDSHAANPVARSCCLARDMIEGVRAVNERAAQNQLPLLEMGIGVCFQPSAPMYLMDGESRIMISKALNQSDRLSGCGKLARQVVGQRNRFFNVFVMQLLGEADSRGGSEEFLLHYNVHGVEINELAFTKLCQELSMSKLELNLPLLGDAEVVELHCGMVPLSPSHFQKIVVRRGLVPRLDPKDFHVVEYTTRCYFEVCSARPLLDYVSRQLGW